MNEKSAAAFLVELKSKKYESGITLITPSGERPQCIQRTKYYIERQTYRGPLQWIVCDDSNIHYDICKPDNVTTFNHKKRKYPGNKSDSFRGNVIGALSLVLYDKIIIIEDDDWYSPDYIKLYNDRLNNYELVGEGPARYYNVASKSYRILGNTKRASFCQTALQTKIIEKLYISCQKDSAFVDARLWNKHCSRKIVFQDKAHCIGIKGMPGRKGIGMGHRAKSFSRDKDWKILAQWIGKEDTEFYKQFAQ
jgi:hypothetical protein